MECLLLLWDEMDDWVAVGRHVVGGTVTEVAGAAQALSNSLVNLASNAGGWLAARRAG